MKPYTGLMIKKFKQTWNEKKWCLFGFHDWEQISDIAINPFGSIWGGGYYDAPHHWEEKCKRCGKQRVSY